MTDMGSPPPDGVQLIQLGLSGGTAGVLADLISIQQDLRFARGCAEAYAGWSLPDGPQSQLIKQALWKSSCIAYRRVFASGKGHLDTQRSRLKFKKDWTDNLTPEQLSTHNKVLAAANQHVAHRVNDLEQVLVLGLLAPPPMPRSVMGVGTAVIHMVGPADGEAEQLMTICDLLLAVAEQEVSRLSDQITERLKQDDIDSLYAAAEKQDSAHAQPSSPPAPES